MFFLMIFLQDCSITPIYLVRDLNSLNEKPILSKKLSSIAIDSPNDRITQIVRNHLIYLFSEKTKKNSSNPSYNLSLNITCEVQKSLRVNIGSITDYEGYASSGVVIINSNYILYDAKKNPIFKGEHSVSSSFDNTRQEYANLRSEENSKENAAEELSERIFLSISEYFLSLKD